MPKKDRIALREGESFPVYTITEMCALLQVKAGTLRKWRLNGTGPPFIRNHSRSIVYLRSSVHDWLKKREKRIQVSYAKLRRPGLRRRSTRADRSPTGTQPPGAPRKGARLTVIST